MGTVSRGNPWFPLTPSFGGGNYTFYCIPHVLPQKYFVYENLSSPPLHGLRYCVYDPVLPEKGDCI